jgi:hypothetical protein
MARKYAAEFLGTILLVFFGAGGKQPADDAPATKAAPDDSA